MRRFRRIAGGALVATFDADEAGVLRDLAGEIATLLSGVADGDEPELRDPAVARLLPDAYRDDEEAAAEFRRFTSPGLAERKVRNARLVVAALTSPETEEGDRVAPRRLFRGPGLGDVAVSLDEDQAQAWLRCLTDLRLALAARLGIESDDDEGGDDPRSRGVYAVYGWLGFVQDSLIGALDRR